MSFDTVANNLARIPIGASHASGASTLVLGVTGTSGTVFPATPFRITAITGASYGTAAESLTIYSVTQVQTNTPAGQCTLTVAAIEGTTDQNYGTSDFAEMRLTAGTISDLNSAVATLQGSVGTVPSGVLKGSGGALAAATAGTDYLTPTGSGAALTGITAAQVGLGSVTNDAQTRAAIVPNTAPTAGGILVGNAGGTAYAPVAMSGDAALSAAGAITVTKTNGTAFAASAKVDTTNAANITSGTLPNARLSAVPNTALANSSITISGHAVSLGGSVALAAADVGLGSVTNDAQTKAAVVPNTAPTNGQLLIGNGTSYVPATLTAGSGVTITNGAGSITVAATGGGSGTVTSVGLSLPSTFTVTGSPVTSSGTLTATYAQQNANIVFAGPSSGAPGGPAFRALVAADLPIFVASGASHAAGAVPDPGSVAGTAKFLREDATWAVPAGGSATPGGANTQIQYNNAGAFGGAANLTIGSGGQLHFGSIATPGTPADGDEWNDATQGCRAYRNGGLTGFRSHVLYLQTTNPAAITAAGNTTIIGSGIGTVSLPANYLNTLGRILRIHARLYGSTASASPGTFNMSLLLGGNVVATGGGTNMGTGRANDVVQFDVLLAVRSTGSAGTIDVTGTFHGSYNGTACILSNPTNAVLNGTAVGTQTVGTPVTVNLTTALALDIQLTLGSTVAGNTFTPTHVLVEVLA